MAIQVSSNGAFVHVSTASLPNIAVADTQQVRWANAAVTRLSRREQEILPLLAARWTDQEIADALCISYRTVTTHVSHIFDKLGINSRRAAAAFARSVDATFNS